MGSCLPQKWCVRFGIALNLHGNGRPQVTGRNWPRPLFNKRAAIIGCLCTVVFGWSGLLKSFFSHSGMLARLILFCIIYMHSFSLCSCGNLTHSVCVCLTLGQMWVSLLLGRLQHELTVSESGRKRWVRA